MDFNDSHFFVFACFCSSLPHWILICTSIRVCEHNVIWLLKRHNNFCYHWLYNLLWEKPFNMPNRHQSSSVQKPTCRKTRTSHHQWSIPTYQSGMWVYTEVGLPAPLISSEDCDCLMSVTDPIHFKICSDKLLHFHKSWEIIMFITVISHWFWDNLSCSYK